ncbi:MAG: stage II sporulation protein M [Chloroflexi bacterium]|nr:stage II sporulation protein M [Chloroflexota bacterium]
MGKPLASLLAAFVGALVMGVVLASMYTLPLKSRAQFSGEQITANLSDPEFCRALALLIFTQKVRALLLAALLGTFTFGVLGILIFMLPWVLVDFAAGQIYLTGENPFLFVLGAIVPHALIELPAIMLAIAAGAALAYHRHCPAAQQDLERIILGGDGRLWPHLFGPGAALAAAGRVCGSDYHTAGVVCGVWGRKRFSCCNTSLPATLPVFQALQGGETVTEGGGGVDEGA